MTEYMTEFMIKITLVHTIVGNRKPIGYGTIGVSPTTPHLGTVTSLSNVCCFTLCGLRLAFRTMELVFWIKNKTMFLKHKSIDG